MRWQGDRSQRFEIGVEVKILAKAMIKQIDRVMTSLRDQEPASPCRGKRPVALISDDAFSVVDAYHRNTDRVAATEPEHCGPHIQAA
jgi:hypothetical protein